MRARRQPGGEGRRRAPASPRRLLGVSGLCPGRTTGKTPAGWQRGACAHLASLAALTPNDPILQPGFEDADTTVDAAICLYGYYGRYYGRGDDERLPST